MLLTLHVLLCHVFQLARDEQFVQKLIPDECGLDMRALISLLVEHDPRHRYSATQALQCEYDVAFEMTWLGVIAFV